MLAVVITAAVMMFMWQDQASYKPVFGAREKVAASDMMGVLEAEADPLPHPPGQRPGHGPEGELGKVRMLLAAKGVTAQLPAGLELMDRTTRWACRSSCRTCASGAAWKANWRRAS